MNSRIVIKNANILLPSGLVFGKDLVLQDGKIVGVVKGEAVDGNVYDAQGGYVLPGFVELHAHGGDGFDFMDQTEEAFFKLIDKHFENGVTTLLPTCVSAPLAELEKFFELYRRVETRCKTATLGGIHLEGPFLSMAMKGAQNPRYLLYPEKSVVDEMLSVGGDVIKRITAAPELDGAEYLALESVKRGIKLCIGHSDATAEQTIKAVDWGYTHITHLYSNTPSNRKIGQRVFAGIVEAAYLKDEISIELIGDGRHVAKETMLMAAKIKGVDKTALVSDAMRAAGTDVTESYLGAKLPENRVIVEDGVAKLPDRSFYAGSIASGISMLKNAVNNYGISLLDVSKMMSLTPARLAGMDDKKGSIEKGKDADIVITDKNFNIKKVFSVRQTTV